MKNPLDILFVRDKHVCPWWCCFSFDNPVRKLFHNPAAMLGRYIRPGSVAVDIGAGMGFFTIPLAGMVGAQGRVLAVDIQQRMLDSLMKRAGRAQVAGRVCTSLGLEQDEHCADFVLAFWMVHEVPDRGLFFSSVRRLMKPDARFFMAEPALHVTKSKFEATVRAAREAGLKEMERPSIALSRCVVFTRG